MKEYSFALFTLNLTDDVRKGENPFTGEEVIFHIDAPLSTQEYTAIVKHLDRYKSSVPDDGGYRYFDLPNGSRVGVGGFFGSSSDVKSLSIEFLVKNEFSKMEASVVNNLVQSGNMYVGSTMDPDIVATNGPVSDKSFYQRHSKVTEFTDEASLVEWVKKYVGFREVYRGANVGQP